MKLFKQVLEKNKSMIILYLSIGISMTFLELYLVTYYQKILDLVHRTFINLFTIIAMLKTR